MNAKWTKILLSAFLIAGACGGLSVLGSFDMRVFAHSLLRFNPAWVAAALGMSIAQVFWQLFRFWVNFRPEDRPPSGALLLTTAEGQLLNSLTPLRSGDAYKVVRLTAAGTALGAVLSALLTERAADGMALFALSGYAATPVSLQLIHQFFADFQFWPTAAGLAVLLLGAYGISKTRFLRKILTELMSSMNSRRFVLCLGVSFVTWIFDAGTLVCSAKAGGLNLTPAQAMTCVFALNLGIALPLTVANVGVFEASLGFALSASIVGLGIEKAVSIATVEHAVKIGGLLGCWGLLLLMRSSRKTALGSAPSSESLQPESV